jgi:acyl-coenzyme A synthetase/AMP-(fatty) acid ligase
VTGRSRPSPWQPQSWHGIRCLDAQRRPGKRPKTYLAAFDLPHTATGKLMRRVVADNLGLAGAEHLGLAGAPQAEAG